MEGLLGDVFTMYLAPLGVFAVVRVAVALLGKL